MSLIGLKNMFKSKNLDETQFILGIDLGDSTSSICYFDVNRKIPEIIDISGGYGKANMPTVVQYIPQSREWVFGEYAILNKGMGNDITFSSLVSKLGKKEYVEIDHKLESVVSILSLYLKELINNCKNINPKAEIAGIVVSLPSYISDDGKEELLRCFSLIGYDRKILDFVTDRECIFANYYFGKSPVKENVLVLDYGSRELRGSLYEVLPDGKAVNINTLSYLYDKNIGSANFESKINEIFIDMYSENTKTPKESIPYQILEQISVFSYQHKDIIFQRSIFNKDVKLYFNFAYPPFQCSFSKKDSEEFINPFKESLKDFLSNLFKNNIKKEDTPIDFGDIDTVICAGGGFEMLWIKEAINDFFPDSHIIRFKNSKASIAEGASILAASYLEAYETFELNISDELQLKEDIGIFILKNESRKFIPIIEKNCFWWQGNKAVRIIVNEKTEEELEIELFRRNSEGKILTLTNLKIKDVAKRPKGALKLELSLSLENIGLLKARVMDLGFGEFFQSTGLKEEYYISLQR